MFISPDKAALAFAHGKPLHGSSKRSYHIAVAGPFDLNCALDVWPDDLMPIGEDTWEKEPFAEWWARNLPRLEHLPRDLCEQWIYRHWRNSHFTFLPLDTLECERHSWSGEQILSSIYRSWGGELSPQFDYDTFQRKGGDDRLPTAKALDNGTWDFPMVLLSTPSGVIEFHRTLPDIRLVLVEGHQRHRYLNALHELGIPPTQPHEVLIIRSPVVS